MRRENSCFKESRSSNFCPDLVKHLGKVEEYFREHLEDRFCTLAMLSSDKHILRLKETRTRLETVNYENIDKGDKQNLQQPSCYSNRPQAEQ